jgi:hypothetical protein
MKRATKQRLLIEIDEAIKCIELLDDRSPISTATLREIRYELRKVEDHD